MLISVIIIATILLIASLFFVSPKLSPVPYFPSNSKDMTLIITSLILKNNQSIIDLGAGDGVVIFEAARHALQKKLNTQFIAIDINPILVLIMHVRRFFHPNKKNIKIVKGDFFNLNYKNLISKNHDQITVYLYVSPWLIEKIIKAVDKTLKKYHIVSYFYKVPHKKPSKMIEGIHKIYIYN